ncbi:hypothetical protein SARC_12573 [Sphaeroforma arctica JP610]|uniref:Histone chaperone RTT106/FACT complex subunit SPT16-like middle domain-containing protein n=1 Tax=Sphaeroforma arctica JP610 TaxID=667725 RepID=A0A0L0FDN8_9EUKA|nr:hypothetical protein SARC_12573 [Sphaeroforma arctica JP610]KNC74892.1 hypothetical protein SARC_12573 [Sphaeroforma arctica JP610]|eukprot:XP_014148794.1 hypothetical protein SARC_12573 [Sphaeroforma arctica JP610]
MDKYMMPLDLPSYFNDGEKEKILRIHDGASVVGQIWLEQMLDVVKQAMKRLESDKTSATVAKTLSPTNVESPAVGAVVVANPISFASSISDVSFTVPFRKKKDMFFGDTTIYVNAPGAPMNLCEPLAMYTKITLLVCVDTPDKVKPVWTYVGFGDDLHKPLFCFTMPAKLPNTVRVVDKKRGADSVAQGANDEIISNMLTQASGIPVCHTPDIVGTLSPLKIKRTYAKCHLKVKEGALYSLSDGILFGLKTPTFFISYNRITGMEMASSGSNRTFSLAISYTAGTALQDGIGEEPVEEEDINLEMFDSSDTNYVSYIIQSFKKWNKRKRRLSNNAEEKKSGTAPATSEAPNKAQHGAGELEDGSDDSEDSAADSDFNPNRKRDSDSDADSDCPEEFDENYESSESGDESEGARSENGDDSDDDDEQEETPVQGREKKRRRSSEGNEGGKRARNSEVEIVGSVAPMSEEDSDDGE